MTARRTGIPLMNACMAVRAAVDNTIPSRMFLRWLWRELRSEWPGMHVAELWKRIMEVITGPGKPVLDVMVDILAGAAQRMTTTLSPETVVIIGTNVSRVPPAGSPAADRLLRAVQLMVEVLDVRLTQHPDASSVADWVLRASQHHPLGVAWLFWARVRGIVFRGPVIARFVGRPWFSHRTQVREHSGSSRRRLVAVGDISSASMADPGVTLPLATVLRMTGADFVAMAWSYAPEHRQLLALLHRRFPGSELYRTDEVAWGPRTWQDLLTSPAAQLQTAPVGRHLLHHPATMVSDRWSVHGTGAVLLDNHEHVTASDKWRTSSETWIHQRVLAQGVHVVVWDWMTVWGSEPRSVHDPSRSDDETMDPLDERHRFLRICLLLMWRYRLKTYDLPVHQLIVTPGFDREETSVSGDGPGKHTIHGLLLFHLVRMAARYYHWILTYADVQALVPVIDGADYVSMGLQEKWGSAVPIDVNPPVHAMQSPVVLYPVPHTSDEDGPGPVPEQWYMSERSDAIGSVAENLCSLLVARPVVQDVIPLPGTVVGMTVPQAVVVVVRPWIRVRTIPSTHTMMDPHTPWRMHCVLEGLARLATRGREYLYPRSMVQGLDPKSVWPWSLTDMNRVQFVSIGRSFDGINRMGCQTTTGWCEEKDEEKTAYPNIALPKGWVSWGCMDEERLRWLPCKDERSLPPYGSSAESAHRFRTVIGSASAHLMHPTPPSSRVVYWQGIGGVVKFDPCTRCMAVSRYACAVLSGPVDPLVSEVHCLVMDLDKLLPEIRDHVCRQRFACLYSHLDASHRAEVVRVVQAWFVHASEASGYKIPTSTQVLYSVSMTDMAKIVQDTGQTLLMNGSEHWDPDGMVRHATGINDQDVDEVVIVSNSWDGKRNGVTRRVQVDPDVVVSVVVVQTPIWVCDSGTTGLITKTLVSVL